MMNRAIKFRAWNRVDKNGMIDLEKITPLIGAPVKGLFIPFDDNIILMQYTGLRDVNGTEIYEGDIDISNTYGKRLVIFDNTQLCFILLWVERYSLYKEYGLVKCGGTFEKVTAKKKLNIIGNIYENPELLK